MLIMIFTNLKLNIYLDFFLSQQFLILVKYIYYSRIIDKMYFNLILVLIIISVKGLNKRCKRICCDIL